MERLPITKNLYRRQNKFTIKGKTITDMDIITQSFNNCFVNIGSTTDKKIPKSFTDPLSYIKCSNSSYIFMNPLDTTEVKTIIMQLKESSPGWDDIQAKIVIYRHTNEYSLDND